MALTRRFRSDNDARQVFATRTETWRIAGLAEEIDRRGTRRAAVQLLLSALLCGVVVVAFNRRSDLFPGSGEALRITAAILQILAGWALGRALVRVLGPTLFRRPRPRDRGHRRLRGPPRVTAGVAIAALRIAGLSAQTVAVGGALTAVVLGLAAQQTIGNLFAVALEEVDRDEVVMRISAPPDRVADGVRLAEEILAVAAPPSRTRRPGAGRSAAGAATRSRHARPGQVPADLGRDPAGPCTPLPDPPRPPPRQGLQPKTPQSIPTFTVDGAVAGTWRYEKGRVEIEPFERLDAASRRDLADEAERLAALHR